MSIAIASGMRLTPARLNAGQPLVVYKSANQVVNNVGALQNDNHLLLTAAANASYKIELRFMYTSSTTADFELGFTLPSGASGTVDGIGYDSASVLLTFGPLAITTSPFSWGGTGVPILGIVTGNLITTTGGTVRLRWCQRIATATNTTVHAGSSLTLLRYA